MLLTLDPFSDMLAWCGHMLPKVVSKCSFKLKIQLFGKFLTCLGTSKIFIFIKKFNRNLFINSGLNHILQHLNINFHLVLENVDNLALNILEKYDHSNPISWKRLKTGLVLTSFFNLSIASIILCVLFTNCLLMYC